MYRGELALHDLVDHRRGASGASVFAWHDRDAAPVSVDVVSYDKLAEVCAEHLEKGRQLAFTGRLDYRSGSQSTASASGTR